MSEPHDQVPDELISAYLDGEVDLQQRARVEHLLDSEPRYQRMLDELRTLRETLQSLPRKRLDASFQERVLRAAQQRSAAAAHVTPARKSALGDGPKNSSRGFLRGLIWAAAAVAAAVLLSVFSPEAPERDIGLIAENPPARPVHDSTGAPQGHADDARGRPRRAGEEVTEPTEGLPRSERVAERATEEIAPPEAESFDRELGMGGLGTSGVEEGSPVTLDSPESDLAVTEARNDHRPKMGLPAVNQSFQMQSLDPAAEELHLTDDDPSAGESSDTLSTELLADAVIYVRLAEAERSAEARLTDALLQNQVAVVRQEPSETPAPTEPEQTRMAREVYNINQHYIDYALAQTESESELVTLYLVEAPVSQIATTVTQLQQEQGTVLSAIAIGRQPAEAGRMLVESDSDAQAARIAPKSRAFAGKGGSEGFAEELRENEPVYYDTWYEIVEGKGILDERFATVDRDAPSRSARAQGAGRLEKSATLDFEPAAPAPTRDGEQISGLQPNSRPRTPETLGGGTDRSARRRSTVTSRGLQRPRGDTALPATPAERGAQTWAAPYGRDSQLGQPAHLRQSATPLYSIRPNLQHGYRYQALVRDPQAIQQQLTELTAGKDVAHRLQVLFVLHSDANLTASALEAPPTTAEAPADPAPSDPR